MKRKYLVPGAALAVALATGPASATELADATGAYLLNTLFLLICGALVMFMAAGFAMLEAGSVRNRSVTAVCAKNVALYAVAGVVFYLFGYQAMYGESLSGLIGIPGIWHADDASALSGADLSGHASGADWFFQMVFVATAASVVSGALAERVRFWAFVASTVVLAAVIYPAVGHWTWGGGWLASLGFADFAGSTIVHSVGGWVALTGIVILGPRLGRFGPTGQPLALAPSSLPYVTLGTFILWLGWFGFNGGSQLSFSTVEDAVAVSNIFVNTNAAAAAGVLAMAIVSFARSGKMDLPLMLNGALAGLVSITAEPAAPGMAASMAIGAVGALAMLGATRLLEGLGLDDAVGAIPVHLAAGAWGTIAVAFSNPDASLAVQALGVVAVGGFAATVSWVVWTVIDGLMGAGLPREQQKDGCDLTEFGMPAYKFD